MKNQQYDIFISYRRKDTGDKAEHLKDLLEKEYSGKVSFDRENLSGLFDIALLSRIDSCKDFIIVLGKETFNYSLEEFSDEQVALYRELSKLTPVKFREKTQEIREQNRQLDFVRVEIARALNCDDINIIPIVPEGTANFSFSSLHLPKDIVDLKSYEAIFYSDSPDALFKDIIPKIKARLKTKSTSIILRKWHWYAFGVLLTFLAGLGFGINNYIVQKKKQALARIECIYPDLVFHWSNDISLKQISAVNDILESMIPVEGGDFLLGASKNHDGKYDTDVCVEIETPQIPMHISSFRINKYELSVDEWGRIMGEKYDKERANYPKTDITFYQVVEDFVKRLNYLTGLQFDIPTEAEWEYAARGGNLSEGCKFAGSNNPNKVAWYNNNSDNICHERIDKKGGLYCNELELYDMSGNVSEWCNTDFRLYSDIVNLNPNPVLLDSTAKIVRGGNFMSERYGITVYHRDFMSASSHTETVGFRLILRELNE